MKNIGAVDDKFYKTSAFKSFARKLQNNGYSNGEIELIAKEASKIFSASLKDVADADLKKHPFKVKYLEEAMKMNGEAASKTNKLMDVKGNKQGSSTSRTRNVTVDVDFDDLNWWEKLKFVFNNFKKN